MSENPFAITKLNDFIFCPASIYFHDLDSETDVLLLQSDYQLNGSAVHSKTDSGQYSDRVEILQAQSVYSAQYNLFGKIDVFDVKKAVLTERKKHISRVYDGYVFQLYAQCFALREMGYQVRSIRLYSYDNNVVFPIPLPEDDAEMYSKFLTTIKKINDFELESFVQTNVEKCKNCIYESMCSFSLKG